MFSLIVSIAFAAAAVALDDKRWEALLMVGALGFCVRFTQDYLAPRPPWWKRKR